MSASNDMEANLRFVQALQSVFGTQCRQFNSDLRGALRRLYDAAHADGVVDAMQGTRPTVKVGDVVDHFGSLQPGMLIQNDHLFNNGQARKILSVEKLEFPNVVSILVDLSTGKDIGQVESYAAKTFQTYSPYRAVDPVAKKGAA